MEDLGGNVESNPVFIALDVAVRSVHAGVDVRLDFDGIRMCP